MSKLSTGSFGIPIIEGFDDAYWSAFRPEVQALRWLSGSERQQRAAELALQGYAIDQYIHFNAIDPLTTHQQRTLIGAPYVYAFDPVGGPFNSGRSDRPMYPPFFRFDDPLRRPFTNGWGNLLPTIEVPAEITEQNVESILANVARFYPPRFGVVPRPPRPWWQFWRPRQ